MCVHACVPVCAKCACVCTCMYCVRTHTCAPMYQACTCALCIHAWVCECARCARVWCIHTCVYIPGMCMCTHTNGNVVSRPPARVPAVCRWAIWLSPHQLPLPPGTILFPDGLVPTSGHRAIGTGLSQCPQNGARPNVLQSMKTLQCLRRCNVILRRTE